MPRASSRPTYRRREEKKEKEISPASKIERFLLFRGSEEAEAGVESKIARKSDRSSSWLGCSALTLWKSHVTTGWPSSQTRKEAAAAAAATTTEADTEGRKCNRSQELEIESNFLHLLALSLLSPLPRPDHSFSQTVRFRSSSTAARPPTFSTPFSNVIGLAIFSPNRSTSPPKILPIFSSSDFNLPAQPFHSS